MFKTLRLRSAHARFLHSCRSLKADRAYWEQATGFRKWFLELVTPVPALGLTEEGKLLLSGLQWLESHCREIPLSEDTIRRYHQMIHPGSGAGAYRTQGVYVVGSKIPRALPQKVAALMAQLDQKLKHAQDALDALPRQEDAAVLSIALDLHQRLGLIHPFDDGNGRVSRLAMNHVLRRYGMGYVILPRLDESPDLMNALQEAHKGNAEPLTAIARGVRCRI